MWTSIITVLIAGQSGEIFEKVLVSFRDEEQFTRDGVNNPHNGYRTVKRSPCNYKFWFRIGDIFLKTFMIILDPCHGYTAELLTLLNHPV